MRAMIVLYALLAVGIGAFVVVQASINGELRGLVGDPYRTALVSTTVSTIFLFVLSGIVYRRPIPAGHVFTDATWWMWVGSGAFRGVLRRGYDRRPSWASRWTSIAARPVGSNVLSAFR